MNQDGQSKILQQKFVELPDEFKGVQGLLNGDPVVKKHIVSNDLVVLEKAPNAIKFIESPDFWAGPELFPVQYEIIRDFFELLCPHCNDIDRVRIKNDVPREDQILFEYEACPKCGLRKLDIADQLNFHNELIGVLGMRSGKSILAACVSGWMVHEALCCENFREKLGVVKNQELDGAFVASTGEQASETVFGQFKGFYEDSPWFQNYKKSLMDLELSDSRFKRGDLYREADRYIYWKDKHLKVASVTTNASSKAGHTRIFAVIDEMSRLDSGDSKRSATEVYRVFQRSLMTARAACNKLRAGGVIDIPDARMIVISSPLFTEDKTMQLLRQAEKQERIFAFHKATWEANPNITKEDLADEFEADPIGAERDYGANPPGAENPFIKDRNIVEACIDTDRTSIFTVRESYFDQIIGGHTFKYIKYELIDVRFINTTEYAIHCDPGKSSDSFCLAIGHSENGIEMIDGAIEARPIPKGNRQGLEPRIIHFPSITAIILKLNTMMSLKMVTYDRWNSEEQIQKLRDAKILAIGKDITRDDHVRFLRSMESRKIRFPKREIENADMYSTRNVPCARALWELNLLNDNGMRVDHRTGGHNDMIQCYVGVHRALDSSDQLLTKKEAKVQLDNRIRSIRKEKSIGRIIRMRR